MEPLPEHIGKYRVRARLGEGATSEVFLAHDEFRGQDVAIKRARPGMATGAREHQQFFANEAALAGRLQHPNVVHIHDAVFDAPEPYLVMEYVPGPTLRHFCRADALLPLDQVVEIGFKCANALDYVFRQGLIHRDVKPANILTVTEGEEVVNAKITDFGSVFDLGTERTQIFRVGSLAYMSPEQLEGDPIDSRADIYSLAAVLYHLVAGRPPFDAATQPAMIHQIFNAEPAPLLGQREGVTPRLDALVRQALAKRREDRPADWDAFAQGLSALVSDHQVPRRTLQAPLDSERFGLMRRLEFFTGFGDAELWEVVHRAKWLRFPADHALFKRGEQGGTFHIIAEGRVDVYRDGQCVATLGPGTSVGEMAYLAPSEDLRRHATDAFVVEPLTTISFTPKGLQRLSIGTRHLFDAAFIRVLVRRLHSAHEALAHPRRIL